KVDVADLDDAVLRLDAHVRAGASGAPARGVDDGVELRIARRFRTGAPGLVIGKVVVRSVERVRPARALDIFCLRFVHIARVLRGAQRLEPAVASWQWN